MKLLTLFFILIFSFSAFSQNKRKMPAKARVTNDTILAVVLSKMSVPEICGKAEWAEKESYIGTVLKRQFNDSEMELNGFVLREANDERAFINIDSEYISTLAASASGDLSSFLKKGVRVKVLVYRCRQVLYAYKIIPL